MSTSTDTHCMVVEVATQVLNQPDLTARFHWALARYSTNPTDQPTQEVFYAQLLLAILGHVLHDSGPGAVRQIRATHQKLQLHPTTSTNQPTPLEAISQALARAGITTRDYT